MEKVLSSGVGVTAKARCISCNNTRHTERVEITARKFDDADVADIRCERPRYWQAVLQADNGSPADIATTTERPMYVSRITKPLGRLHV